VTESKQAQANPFQTLRTRWILVWTFVGLLIIAPILAGLRQAIGEKYDEEISKRAG
jgi:hypothetical protein